jgi:hypothetical protein
LRACAGFARPEDDAAHPLLEFNLQELSEDLDVSPGGSRKSKPAAACAVFTIHQSTRASSRFYRLNSMT